MISINSSLPNFKEINIDTDKDKGFYADLIDQNEIDHKLQEIIDGADKPIRIAFIFNTVSQAQKFYHEIDKNMDKLLIHSRFLITDRLFKEQEVLKLVGKNSQNGKSVIIIGTQVLEQSLDIDFDVMFTDLSPMSLIFQRAGRLHRHKRYDRPSNTLEPHLFVIKNDKTITKYHINIYSKYEIKSSEYYIAQNQGKKLLYNDISKVLYEISEIKIQDISEYRTIYKNNIQEKELKGESYRIRKPEFFNNNSFYDWLSLETQNDDKDAMGYARVRDIQSGPTVFALFKNESNQTCVKYRNEKGTVKFYPIEDLWLNENGRPFLWKILHASEITLPKVFAHYKYIHFLEENVDSEAHKIFQSFTSLRSEIPIIFDNIHSFTIKDKELKYDSCIGLYN